LARYLTRPVRLLRGAARRLADGDLSARVGVAGRRRDEIGDLGRDFDVMADHLENLLIAQQRLLRDISHELRSPLARLNVALELARRDSGSAAEPALARVGREAERLNELIGQLLTLARLEGGAAQPAGAFSDRVEIDLAVLVSEVAADADFEAAVRDRHVRIVQSEPCRIIAAPGLLRSAIENVVRNAVRFTAPGTDVEIRLACRADGAEPRAIIEVRDHGSGVPEAALQDIFRPFYRVANARERETGGAGLGLAITERTIRSYGGAVRAANAPDGGLSVQIELPCTSSDLPAR
jgi:two-component system sensor histidine kinase CpxA